MSQYTPSTIKKETFDVEVEHMDNKTTKQQQKNLKCKKRIS
jgi:hypothetical protein